MCIYSEQKTEIYNLPETWVCLSRGCPCLKNLGTTETLVERLDIAKHRFPIRSVPHNNHVFDLEEWADSIFPRSTIIRLRRDTYSATLKANSKFCLLSPGLSWLKSKVCGAKRCIKAQKAMPSAQEDEKLVTLTF